MPINGGYHAEANGAAPVVRVGLGGWSTRVSWSLRGIP